MKYYLNKLYLLLITPAPLSMWKQLGLLFVAVVAPYAALIHLLLVFVFIDLITGIGASYKTFLREEMAKGNKLTFKNKIKLFWSNFHSSKLRYTVEKLAVYLLVILLFSFFEKYFLAFSIAGFTLTKIVAMILSIIEIKSILENFSTITNKKFYVAIFNLFKKQVDSKIGDIKDITDSLSNEDDKLKKE